MDSNVFSAILQIAKSYGGLKLEHFSDKLKFRNMHDLICPQGSLTSV